MAARGGGAAAESDCANGNKWGRSDDDDEYESNDAEATAFARRQHPIARRPPPAPRVAIWWMCRGPPPVHDGARMRPTGVTNNVKGATELPLLKICGGTKICPCSIGHPPHSSASPVELRLRVGPRALSEKKELR